MLAMIKHLFDIAHLLDLSLPNAVDLKQEVNHDKFPAPSCGGAKIDKYLVYSLQTEISSTTAESLIKRRLGMVFGNRDHFRNEQCIIQLQEWMQNFLARSLAFVRARNWEKFDVPTSVYLALMTEVGELTEVLRFEDDEEQSIDMELFGKCASELADVYIFSTRLIHHLGCFQKVKGDLMQFKPKLVVPTRENPYSRKRANKENVAGNNNDDDIVDGK